MIGYADALKLYTRAGSAETLRPIPVSDAAPRGFRNWHPDLAQRWASSEHWMHARTASSPAPGFVFLDDDDATLCAALEAQIGSRPATLYTTSRGRLSETQGRAKRLYRVPADAALRDGYSGGDIIDHFHRFAFIGPTRNAKTLEAEQWYLPDGSPLPGVPTAADIAQHTATLPAAWVEHLKRDRPYGDAPAYSGSLTFDAGSVAPWLSDIAGTWGDWSEYRQAQRALWNLAGVAVMLPETPGIDTLRHAITSEYVNRANASSSPADSQGALDRAWTNGLAKQAAERDALEAEVGGASLAWAASKLRGAVPEAPTFSERLEADAYKRAAQGDFSAFERAVMGDPAGYAEERAEKAAESVQTAPEPERGGWTPLDLAPVLTGEYVAPEATVMRRADGVGLLYREAVNGCHGEPGGGKSWFALSATSSVLAGGGHVLYLDFEDHAPRVVNRLRLLGTSDDALSTRLHYANPEGDPLDTAKPYAAQVAALLDAEPAYDLVVFDGITEALALSGMGSNSGDEWTTWARLPKAFARTGAAVLTVDHVVKDAQNRGRFATGSGQKLATITGASYSLEVKEPLAPNRHGYLAVKIAKDRHGYVQANSEHGGKGLALAGEFHLYRADALSDRLTAEIRQPEAAEHVARAAQQISADRERIAYALQEAGGSLPSMSKLWESLEVQKNGTDELRTALDALISDGFVVVEDGARNSKSLHLKSNIAPTPEADAENDLVPVIEHPASQVQVPGDTADTQSSIRVSETDTRGHSDTRSDKPKTPPRSVLTGVTDAELDALLDEPDPEPDTTQKGN
ncbi:AAA family ATPase [Microbacterium sp. VKM Ac-2923]|uniref:AAA family ATPase n=1 Tax=Microbacterium sp. VKM Ac-2923 TaxID=2929476 RepID=UPI001FB35479|nr:AAA family ATPase [Microbacterium sp. VKM Ac-2923]MCJ1707423.1 AAA family ATPase [Microbacterium sp. VKM Ac-2923]